MRRIIAIARHTVAEGVRMNIALVFMAILLFLVVGLPFSLQSENSVSAAVQSFLSLSLRLIGFVLLVLTVFLSRSLSDDMVQRHILILMTKPIPRWQYVVGKWLGIMTINAALLTFSVVGVYVVVRVMSTMPPRDELDKSQLHDEVLVARHAIRCTPPDFAGQAALEYEKRRETGYYAVAPDPAAEIKRLTEERETMWRTLYHNTRQVFQFENIRCERSPEKTLQIRYKPIVYNYPPDEVLRCEWVVGNPDKGTALYFRDRRDVINRNHVFSVPTDAVADDLTLRVELRNVNPYEDEPQFHNTITFNSLDDIQVLFAVGSFEGNLLRQTLLSFFKLTVVAAIAILCACVFSFPVACLVTFTFLALATMAGYLDDSVNWFYEDDNFLFIKKFARFIYTVAYAIIPNFSRYDGIDLLVTGRNVTLKWVLNAAAVLGLLYTSVILLVACVLFHRREVAEVSV